MDPKLKALATEYEKARKQNLQLRQALQSEKDKNKALSDEVEQLKNRPMLSVSHFRPLFLSDNFVEFFSRTVKDSSDLIFATRSTLKRGVLNS